MRISPTDSFIYLLRWHAISHDTEVVFSIITQAWPTFTPLNTQTITVIQVWQHKSVASQIQLNNHSYEAESLLVHWWASGTRGASPTTAQGTLLTPPLAEMCFQSSQLGPLDRDAVKCMTLHLWTANLKPILVAHSCMALTACCKCLPMVSRECPRNELPSCIASDIFRLLCWWPDNLFLFPLVPRRAGCDSSNAFVNLILRIVFLGGIMSSVECHDALHMIRQQRFW